MGNMFDALQSLAQKDEEKKANVEIDLDEVQNASVKSPTPNIKKAGKSERFLFEMSPEDKLKLERLRITKAGVVSKAEVLRRLINGVDSLDNL